MRSGEVCARNGDKSPTGAPGDITLFAESDAAKWAVLLPQTGVSPTATISGYSCEIEGTFDITNNYYNSTGVSISMNPPATFTASIDSYQIGEFSWDDKFPGDGDHSRTTLDPYTMEVSFSAGDQISILSTKNSKKRFTTASGGATATFSGAAANDNGFYAISPFRDDNITLDVDFISGVTIPDYQWSDNWGSGSGGLRASWDPAAPLVVTILILSWRVIKFCIYASPRVNTTNSVLARLSIVNIRLLNKRRNQTSPSRPARYTTWEPLVIHRGPTHTRC